MLLLVSYHQAESIKKTSVITPLLFSAKLKYLNVKGMVRNRRLAKSISDGGWTTFRNWLEYFGQKYRKVTIAVPPHNTSQDCSNCGKKVKKTLSTRTHICSHCKYVEDRDIGVAESMA